jgi:protocatechuate 3,4-dioxygenase beta subunit
VTLTIVDATTNAVMPGACVYLWHATREGEYSMYSDAVASENYLRGVQEADESGMLTFTTIFPGCYDGRWPHIHFEVYASLAATVNGAPGKTSQLALPPQTCAAAYVVAGYEQSVANLSRTSLEGDFVFGDGSSLQLPLVVGDAATGFTATLMVGV